MSEISDALLLLRKQSPLVLNITNFVSAEFVANGLLSLGASPVMSDSVEDAIDLAAVAKAAVINLGTVNDHVSLLARKVAEKASTSAMPLVLDPVGAGASQLRTEQSRWLLSHAKVDILRGNGSEIMALADDCRQNTRGVDSACPSDRAVDTGIDLARRYGCVVFISGKNDWVIAADGANCEKIEGGSAMLCRVTGAGCLLTAICAAFHAVIPDSFQAAVIASQFYGNCARAAQDITQGPGSFRQAFLDKLYV